MSPQVAMKSEILEWCSATHVGAQRARHILAKRYPVIALALARQDGNPSLLAISAAIDRGDPLDKAVATLVGVSPAAVAGLENVAPETVTEEWLNCPIELFWAMDVLHSLERPQTPEEWDVLRKLWINTGLERDEAYRHAVGISRKRQVVLEYLFRGLCAQGYGEPVRALADRLVAPLPGIETDSEFILPFSFYVGFVEMLIAPTRLLKRTESSNDAERLLMRYPPCELIRQWESWRCIVAAHGDAGFEVVCECEDMAKARWIMRTVALDFDEAVRWVECHPRQSASLNNSLLTSEGNS